MAYGRMDVRKYVKRSRVARFVIKASKSVREPFARISCALNKKNRYIWWSRSERISCYFKIEHSNLAFWSTLHPLQSILTEHTWFPWVKGVLIKYWCLSLANYHWLHFYNTWWQYIAPNHPYAFEFYLRPENNSEQLRKRDQQDRGDNREKDKKKTLWLTKFLLYIVYFGEIRLSRAWFPELCSFHNSIYIYPCVVANAVDSKYCTAAANCVVSTKDFTYIWCENVHFSSGPSVLEC